jgi:transcriptional regulator with XRE-family HTH domain
MEALMYANLNFGERLRITRERKGILQKDLASLLQLQQQTISAWEKGRGQPDVDNLVKISKFLDCSLDFLLSGESKVAEEPAIYITTQDNDEYTQELLREWATLDVLQRQSVLSCIYGLKMIELGEKEKKAHKASGK